jgi:hypothetical protein
MNIFYIIHILLVIFVISIPFMPLHIVKKIFWLPLIFPMIWKIFGRCPLNDLHEGNSTDGCIHSILQNMFPKLSRENSNDISHIFVFGTFIISLYRIDKAKKYYR